MTDEIDFADLATISRIGTDTMAEKFGGIINASFFEASNILGTLKQKGLIDFSITFPGQNSVTLTLAGKDILSKAEEKASLPIDDLDIEILTQLYNGKKTLGEITESVNVTQKDLAFHMYKLSKQQLINYDFRNGKIDLSLTEHGFVQAKKGSPSLDSKSTMQQSASGQPMTQQSADMTSQPKSDQELLNELDKKIAKMKGKKKMMTVVVIVVIIVAIISIVLKFGIIKI